MFFFKSDAVTQPHRFAESFDKTLLSDMRNIGKLRLYVNYFFQQDVVSVCDGGEQ